MLIMPSLLVIWKKIYTCNSLLGLKTQINQCGEKRWTPAGLPIGPYREEALMQKMERCIDKVESSEFYLYFRNQLQSPPISEYLHRFLRSELKIKMVIYGIGNIEWFENSRLQLSLAILMKKDFSWIGDIEVFDPILSTIESRILEALGCYVLSVNEHGRRQAIKPTMFFMPHCPANLYNNLLQANWGLSLLRNIILLGNSFEFYDQNSKSKTSPGLDSLSHILAARKFTNEFEIFTISDDYVHAFWSLSWHFFSPVLVTELQYVNS